MATKKVLKNLLFSIGGFRVSTRANEVTIDDARARVDAACYEDPGKFPEKGPYEPALKLSIYGTDAEAAILKLLSEMSEASSFMMLWESNILATPVAAIGSPVLMMDCSVFGGPMEAQRGALKRLQVDVESAGSQVYFNDLALSNVNQAVITAATTSTVQNPGVLGAGKELVWGVHLLDPPGFGGTVTSVLIELVSDVDGAFATPVVQDSVTLTEAPGAYFAILDGDTDPIPGETHWAVRITPTGTLPEVTAIAAFGLHDKA